MTHSAGEKPTLKISQLVLAMQEVCTPTTWYFFFPLIFAVVVAKSFVLALQASTQTTFIF
jgi:hypothetical protein